MGEQRCTGLHDLGDLDAPKLEASTSISLIKQSSVANYYLDAEWLPGVVMSPSEIMLSQTSRQLETTQESLETVHYRVPFIDNNCSAPVTSLKISVSMQSAGVMYLNNKELVRLNMVSFILTYNYFIVLTLFVLFQAQGLYNSTFRAEKDMSIMMNFFVGEEQVSTSLNEFAATVFAGPNTGDLAILGLAIERLYGKVLVDLFQGWKFLDTDVDPGASWKTKFFDDRPWSRGNVPVWYNVAQGGTQAANNPVTSYYRTVFSMDDTMLNNTLLKYGTIEVLHSDGVVVYVNEVEVGRAGMPSGTVTHNTRATIASDASSSTFAFTSDILVEGANIVAVEIHREQTTSDSLVFSLSASLSYEAPPSTGIVGVPSVGIPAGCTTCRRQRARRSVKIYAAQNATDTDSIDLCAVLEQNL